MTVIACNTTPKNYFLSRRFTWIDLSYFTESYFNRYSAGIFIILLCINLQEMSTYERIYIYNKIICRNALCKIINLIKYQIKYV